MKKILLSIIAALTLFLSLFVAGYCFLPYYYASTIESRILQRYPLMVLISLKSPVEFQQYITKLKANILNHGDERNDYYYAAALINNEFSKYAAKASDHALYQFLGSEIALYKGLYERNPSYVLYIEFPNKFRDSNTLSNLNKALPYIEVQALENAKEAVITSGVENKSMLDFSDAQANEAANGMNQILQSLNQKYSAASVTAAFFTPNDSRFDQRLSAEIIIHYYEGIYAQGPEKAGDILRVIYATNSATAAR